jgi:DNA-binding transcriptional LysR family regulator
MLPAMDRVVRLYQLWSWLPHFRAVAETEHLPSASEALGVSASALSRALKQLESAVGAELFVRDGRNIRLNPDGQELLRAVRLAMRGIDDKLEMIGSGLGDMPLRVSAPSPYLRAGVIAAVAEVTRKHPRLSPELFSLPSDRIVSALCRGELDVCVHEGLIEHSDLEATKLTNIDKRVACSNEHALAEAGSISAETLAQQRFAAPPPNARGIREDGWPPSATRSIALTVSHMQMGIDACATGHYLAVLPMPVIEAIGLVALETPDLELPTVGLFASHRKAQDSQHPAFADLLAALEAPFHS